MSEIRDKSSEQGIEESKKSKVRSQVITLVRDAIKSHADPYQVADKILSIEGLAVVDREAELPTNPIDTRYTVTSEKRFIYSQAQQDMVKAGWVKEEKR